MQSISTIAPLLPSVGRIEGRGTCILLSMTPDPVDSGLRRAILLTTSHVISKRVEAHGLKAIFFEHPMEGGNSKQKHPVVVLLRPEHVFLSSAEDPKAKQQQQQQPSNSNTIQSSAADAAAGTGQLSPTKNASAAANGAAGADAGGATAASSSSTNDSIGYTIVACDVEGTFFDMNVVRSQSGRVRYARCSELDAYGSTTQQLSKYRPLYQRGGESNGAAAGGRSKGDTTGALMSMISERATGNTPNQQQEDGNNNNNNEDQATTAMVLAEQRAREQERDQREHAAAIAKLPPPSLSSIIPVGLPLVQSRCPAVNKGDTHLVVTHASGGPSRKIYTLTVGEVYDNYCVYNEVDTTVMFSSGGLVFSGESGDMLGLQHQSPGPGCSHYCMFLKQVTHHLFLSHSLGLVQVPILDGNAEDVSGMVGSVAKSILDRDMFVLGEEPLWKRQRDALNRGNPVDKMTQSREAPGKNILTTESRPLHVRERARYGGGYSQLVDYDELQREQKLRAKQVPPTLLVPDHLDVFNYYYSSSKYSSLVHMVACFGYHPLLTKLMLTRLISHEHRNDLQDFSEFQGMPPLLELLERNASNGEIIQAGMTALGRLTQYEMNREALNRYNGLQTLVALLRGWPNSSQIVDWGCFCLLNMSSPDTLRARENVKQITDNGGIALLVGFVRDLGIGGPRSGHTVRWGLQALANCIGDDKRVFDQAIEAGLCSVVFDATVQFADAVYSLVGPATCLVTLVHLEMFDSAVDYFISAGALSVVVSILRGIANRHLRLSAGRRLSNPSVDVGGMMNSGSSNSNSSSGNVDGPSSAGDAREDTVGGSGGGGGGGASLATEGQVAFNLLSFLSHVVEQRGPQIRLDLIRLGCAETAAGCARVFAKESELVNVVAGLVSALSR